MEDGTRCDHCADVIGVYEPMRVLLADGTAVRGSTLTVGERAKEPGSTALHERCYVPYQRAHAVTQANGA